MLELLRTTNPVLLSFVENLLAGSGIGHYVADRHVSTVDGMIGAFPFRVLVAMDDLVAARATLAEAGLGPELPFSEVDRHGG